MGPDLSLIPKLEDVIQRGASAKRIDALQRITALFLGGAQSYSDLFDDVFGLLIAEIETKAREKLSRHLAPVGNAPVNVLRTLAKVPLNVVDRPDPVLILCKAVGLSWATVKAIITLHGEGKAMSSQGLESAFANYDRLSNSTLAASGAFGKSESTTPAPAAQPWRDSGSG
jgi:hypothetical protein